MTQRLIPKVRTTERLLSSGMRATHSSEINLAVLSQLTCFERRSLSTPLEALATALQRESYELRLSLQPNGAAARAQYERLKDTPTHKAFQEAMGRELVRDWLSLGRDTLWCLREFGRLLMAGDVSAPPGNLHAAYINGFVVKHGEQSRMAALDPHLLTNLNYIHTIRWHTQRAIVGLRNQSLSHTATDFRGAAAALRTNPIVFHERVPMVANCNRIGVMLESLVLAKMPESHFTNLWRDAVPGNPFNLPLRIIESSSGTPASLSLATTAAILPASIER